jgi:hypothetical protein
MKSLAMFLAVAIGAVAGVAATQDASASRITITGDVVTYDAGRTIVVRGLDGKDVTYAIRTTVAVPPDIAPGRRVTIVTEPADTGALVVTEIRAGAPAAATVETKGEMTTISGTVSSFEAGRSITILRPNATTVTYRIDANSVLPSDLTRGRKVVVRTVTRPGAPQPLVRKVTYTKTTKRTKTTS